MIENSSLSGLLTRYQHPNHQASCALETNESGDVITYEEYHPFGTTSYQAKSSTITAAAKRYRYTGMERDDESGLSYHNARYYITWLGRWMNSDPIGIGDGVNVYSYCKNDPIGGTDTNGTQLNKPYVNKPSTVIIQPLINPKELIQANERQAVADTAKKYNELNRQNAESVGHIYDPNSIESPGAIDRLAEGAIVGQMLKRDIASTDNPWMKGSLFFYHLSPYLTTAGQAGAVVTKGAPLVFNKSFPETSNSKAPMHYSPIESVNNTKVTVNKPKANTLDYQKITFEDLGYTYKSDLKKSKDGGTDIRHFIEKNGVEYSTGSSYINPERILENTFHVPEKIDGVSMWKRGISKAMYGELRRIGFSKIEAGFYGYSENYKEFMKIYNPKTDNKIEAALATPAGRVLGAEYTPEVELISDKNDNITKISILWSPKQ